MKGSSRNHPFSGAFAVSFRGYSDYNFLRLFQHTELEHTQKTFTNRLFEGTPFIVGVAGGLPGLPYWVCAIGVWHVIFLETCRCENTQESVHREAFISVGNSPNFFTCHFY